MDFEVLLSGECRGMYIPTCASLPIYESLSTDSFPGYSSSANTRIPDAQDGAC
ncbi:hypothetical protein CULCOIPH003_10680 [Corynebacterium ulcerans]|nr:hypothetical protein CULCOIPH001_13830 [Corynebacterium ulcerans]GJJ38437.1 hypothetical protein CULCOIPH003_10680 [Corynebacterium ulcerans]GJJ41441.1 hypothetical protein CULCOIPH004_18520 [Corynebacterium ulcerans]